ncbi:MAG: ATPase, T2SS/T4P/T4SS family [Planctomycetota bacterium]|nr:ATPase, T2SS/T4P/T4SS family [Planctomycetota bacterium]
MPMTLAQDALILVSPWKPVLLLVPLVAWARLISSNYDKHAARFHLEPKRWNSFHLFMGLIAFAVAVLMPLQGILGIVVGLAAEVAILAISMLAYPLIANKDERVPEDHHVKLLDFSNAQEAKEAKAAAKHAGTAELLLRTPDGDTVAVPEKDTEEFTVRVAAEGVFLRGKLARASEIVVRPTGKDQTYGVIFLIDGVPTADTTLPAAEAVKLMDYWKKAGDLDISDRRRKQAATVGVGHLDKKHKVRLTTAGGQTGMMLTLMLDPELAVRRKVSDLGFLAPQTEAVNKIVEDATGTVLLATPPDGGGTTLLYTMVRMHDAYTQNVQTIESDIQDEIEGVRQNPFDPRAEGQEYSTLVRSILRRDPDVVGIAELPDAATAKEICRGDQERTRQYVLLRGSGGLQAIQTWCKAVGDLPAASEALHGVISGTLVRKLCQNCRVGYTPSADMLKKLGLPADKVPQLFKKGGQVLIKNKPETCPMCNGGGYFGQEGVFEVFPLGAAERELVKSGNLAALRAEFRKRGYPTIQQAALLKAVEGITSIEEIMRVTSSGESKKPAAKKAAAAS